VDFTKLSGAEREQLLAALAAMPGYLESVFAGLSPEAARARGPKGQFAPIEQVWHMADLEREGFGTRISRLQRETQPQLPDFDGDTIAKARDYRSLSINKGLMAFARAREQNLASLRAIHGAAWSRAGTQEGVGPVSLCDLPGFMLQHDQAHRAEIEDWKHHYVL